MGKKGFVGLWLLSILLFFSGNQPAAQETREITVSAAISLTDAFNDMGRAFEARVKGVKIHFNYGASGALAGQIAAGAPVDVFASAAQKDALDLDQKGYLVPNSIKIFSANAVVLVQPAEAKATLTTFADLNKNEIRKIAMGNPATVPAGRYGLEVLQFLKIAEAVKEKLVYAENVRQVLDYTARDEVDAGIVYATDAATRTAVKVMAQAPEGSHTPVLYPVALVKGGKNENLAREFIAFVLSAEGQNILRKYGFMPAP